MGKLDGKTAAVTGGPAGIIPAGKRAAPMRSPLPPSSPPPMTPAAATAWNSSPAAAPPPS